MRGWSFILALGLSTLVVAWPLRAEETPSLEDAAAQALTCIATVRVLDAAAEGDENAKPRVTVCTGVCIEKGWVITPAFAGSDSQIRLTHPGGHQSPARLRVIDEYSGLALVEADTKDLTPVKFAKDAAKVGAWVLSSSAWGVEQPVVSFGILSGQNRTAGGMQYPPLLQVDLKTTETSSGAALLNRHGELLGIVVLVDDGQDRRGFTFAVPTSHAQRLLRARVERPALDKPLAAEPQAAEKLLSEVPTSVVVLKRRRPIVGMEMKGIGESIVIDRVIKGSPAEKAGLKVGDVVQGVDGVNIRSVYQGVVPVLHKQPGDVVLYRVQSGPVTRDVEVTLGGGVELPSAPLEALGELIRPKVDIEGAGKGKYVTRTPGARTEMREVFAPAEGAATPRALTPGEKIKLLEKGNDSYRNVIVIQQERIKALEQELKQLKSQPGVK